MHNGKEKKKLQYTLSKSKEKKAIHIGEEGRKERASKKTILSLSFTLKSCLVKPKREIYGS
jgi:hypothetical protein